MREKKSYPFIYSRESEQFPLLNYPVIHIKLLLKRNLNKQKTCVFNLNFDSRNLSVKIYMILLEVLYITPAWKKKSVPHSKMTNIFILFCSS